MELMEQSQSGGLSTWSWGKKLKNRDDYSLSFHCTAPAQGIFVLESSTYSKAEREWRRGNYLEGIRH